MAQVKVFQFLHVDEHHNKDVIAPRMATSEATDRVQGIEITSTMTMVEESELDGSGFYPKKDAS